MFEELGTMLSSGLMQRALLAALLVGVSAPVIGTYLVQRRFTLLGDGIGHIALSGVALGWLAGTILQIRPVDSLTVVGALITSILGSVIVELVRSQARASGDVALALMFYGGMGGGVLLITVAGGTTMNLNSYLFGSISTVSQQDIVLISILAGFILITGLGLRTALFTVSHDEEFARSCGLPTRALNLLIAIVAALTVAVSMRVVGILLVSAIMIVPVATAQLIATTFRSTMYLAMLLGTFITVTGLIITYFYAFPPGAMIVSLAILSYLLIALSQVIWHQILRLKQK